ncbi:MAG: hypothetical protein F7C35_06015, partial [Desulfurococcales archaeon]|nr:hypothetical protein [Desulfurococcales archaeon]
MTSKAETLTALLVILIVLASGALLYQKALSSGKPVLEAFKTVNCGNSHYSIDPGKAILVYKHGEAAFSRDGKLIDEVEQVVIYKVDMEDCKSGTLIVNRTVVNRLGVGSYSPYRADISRSPFTYLQLLPQEAFKAINQTREQASLSGGRVWKTLGAYSTRPADYPLYSPLWGNVTVHLYDSLKYDPGTGALIERTRVATFSYEENVSSSIAPDKQVIVERLENMYIKAG